MALRYLAPALLMIAAPAAQAHEVWIERDGTGPARIYLGEPAEAMPVGGDPEFHHLKAPKLLSGVDPALQRKAGYIEASVPAGDVRAHDDGVFAPWGPDEKKEGIAYFARAGRAEARSEMPFEIAPVTAGGNRFRVVLNGQPLANTEVEVISPDKWTKKLKTDAEGTFTAPTRGKGRYLLTASHKDDAGGETSLGKVAVLHRITTTTFAAN